jgi:hypothetical protein
MTARMLGTGLLLLWLLISSNGGPTLRAEGPALPPPPDLLPPPLDGPELADDWVDLDAALVAAGDDRAAMEVLPTPKPAGTDGPSTKPAAPRSPSTAPENRATRSSLHTPQNDDDFGVVALFREPWQLMTEPWEFLTHKNFTNSAELGLNGTEGNSQTNSLQAGVDLKWQSILYRLRSHLTYQRTHADSRETQHNAIWDNDWERILGQTPWTWNSELMLEYDEFLDFDLRLVMNTGLGYYWIKHERASLSTQIGTGTMRKFGSPQREWRPEARFGVEGEYRITPRQKFTGKSDFYPAWDDFNDFRVVAIASWEILLDGTDNLSVKFAATDRYDSTPEGRLPNDVNYSALLLYRF